MYLQRSKTKPCKLLGILSSSGTGVTSLTVENNIIFSDYKGATGTTSGGTRYIQITAPYDYKLKKNLTLKTMAPGSALPSVFQVTLWVNSTADSTITASSINPGATGSTAHEFIFVPSTAIAPGDTLLLEIGATCTGSTTIARIVSVELKYETKVTT